MPKLWKKTIREHRQSVLDKVLDTTAAVVEIEGPRAVAMSRIAQATGVHRATLYRYFDDVEELLVAYYSRQTARYLAVLTAAKDTWDVGKALSAVVETYALIAHEHHASPMARLVHERIDRILVPSELRILVQQLISRAAVTGNVRGDIPAEELISYALAALSIAETLPSPAAVRRLVAATLDGLRVTLPRWQFYPSP